MTILAVCRDVRPTTGNGSDCMVVASRDEPGGVRTTDSLDPLRSPDIRQRLERQGIVLGGPLPPAAKTGVPSSTAAPVEISAHDEHGQEHRLLADSVEECRLSSGSALYYLTVRAAPQDCSWLVGRPLQLTRASFMASTRESNARASA
jgi:hypothetical protein